MPAHSCLAWSVNWSLVGDMARALSFLHSRTPAVAHGAEEEPSQGTSLRQVQRAPPPPSLNAQQNRFPANKRTDSLFRASAPAPLRPLCIPPQGWFGRRMFSSSTAAAAAAAGALNSQRNCPACQAITSPQARALGGHASLIPHPCCCAVRDPNGWKVYLMMLLTQRDFFSSQCAAFKRTTPIPLLKPIPPVIPLCFAQSPSTRLSSRRNGLFRAGPCPATSCG